MYVSKVPGYHINCCTIVAMQQQNIIVQKVSLYAMQYNKLYFFISLDRQEKWYY